MGLVDPDQLLQVCRVDLSDLRVEISPNVPASKAQIDEWVREEMTELAVKKGVPEKVAAMLELTPWAWDKPYNRWTVRFVDDNVNWIKEHEK